MTENESSSMVVGLRIPFPLLVKIDKLADKEKRTRHNLLLVLIEKGLEAK